MRDVWIRGVAMTRFGRHLDRSGRELAEQAVRNALRDAGLEPHDIDAAFVGNAADRFSRDGLALVSVKNHEHGALNPCARYPRRVTVEDVLTARPLVGALTLLMCAQLSDGAACLVLSAPPARDEPGPRVRIAAS